MRIVDRFTEIIDWYPKAMSKEERHLVFKIDWLVLSFSCISYFTKNLDDLNLYGNRLNYATSMYYVGYAIFQIPSNIVLTRLPAEYYLPAFELLVMRFFVGFTATACWVGNAHIVNSWYTRQELGKRNAIYGSAYTNLSDNGGLAGWRWLFIICTIITIPCALIGVFFCPNVPDRNRSRWFTEREKQMAVDRLLKDGFAKTRGVDRSLFKRILGNWRIYVFSVVGNLFWMTPYPSGLPYTLWLASMPSKYSVPMINNLSTIANAGTIVSTMVCGFYSDWRQNRWETMLYGDILILVCNIVLLVWKVSDGAKFFAFIGLGVANGPTNLIVPWLAEYMSHDLEARSASIAIVNVGWVVINCVVPLVAWPTSAPRYLGGYIWSTIMSVIEIILVPLPMILERQERKRGIDYTRAVLEENGIVAAGLEKKTKGERDVKDEKEVEVNAIAD
ncbi:major facilitator superfamily domain-containing protein [Lipomyces starkeyi]